MEKIRITEIWNKGIKMKGNLPRRKVPLPTYSRLSCCRGPNAADNSSWIIPVKVFSGSPKLQLMQCFGRDWLASRYCLVHANQAFEGFLHLPAFAGVEEASSRLLSGGGNSPWPKSQFCLPWKHISSPMLPSTFPEALSFPLRLSFGPFWCFIHTSKSPIVALGEGPLRIRIPCTVFIRR